MCADLMLEMLEEGKEVRFRMILGLYAHLRTPYKIYVNGIYK